MDDWDYLLVEWAVTEASHEQAHEQARERAAYLVTLGQQGWEVADRIDAPGMPMPSPGHNGIVLRRRVQPTG